MSSSSQGPRRRNPAKNTFTTKSGSTFKVNRSLSDRVKARRDAKARRRAMYLSTLPKNRWKRILYRLHPKRVAKYWFSRDGAIMALKIVGVGIVACFILVIGVFAYFRKDLPNIKDISGTNVGGSITYYDRTGNTVLWQDYGAVKRIPVKSTQISPFMKQATVAIEDKDFYKHGAFDVRGILRAGVHDVFGGGGGVQGGSTITQQLVKLNEQWTADRSITRKIKEVILAVEVEREFSKDDIITGYLNIAPYSGVNYGVETAARDYFNTDAKDLTLAQATMLAAIPKAPTAYSPYSSPQFNPQAGGNYFDASGLIGRQHYILDQMVDQKMITKAQADEAKKVDILAQVHAQQPKYDGIKAPYFVLAAKDQLEQKYGSETVNRGGWKVVTTVDLTLQNLAEQQVQNDLPTIKRQGGDTAAFVAEDNKTGQIVALVGGTDFRNQDYGSINYAHDVNVSPGSSFKPYDYATFIDNNNNVGAGSVLYDQKGAIPGYPCSGAARTSANDPGDCATDYDNQYPGAVTLRYALGGSRNIPAMKAMLSAVPNDPDKAKVNSINKVISTANALMTGTTDGDSYHCYQLGTNIFTASKKDEAQCYTASAIGDGAYLHLDDHVNGIASLARLGLAIPRTYIMKITDANNKIIDQFKQPAGKQVIKPDAAYIVNDMASDPRASYLPGNCTETGCTALKSFGYKFHRYKGWHFAVKTGTTNYGFDGLMASWSTQYTALTWVGYHTRNQKMTGNMETMTEPIVRGWMEGAHDMLGGKPTNWSAPTDIKNLPAYVMSHKISRNGEQIPGPSTDIYPSWYQQPKVGTTTSQTIDVVSGKLATSCTPELAKKVVSGSNDNAFSADIFVKGASTATVDGNDDKHNCNDTKPSITLTAPQTCGGSGCAFTVTVSQGSAALSSDQYPGTVHLLINGQVVDTKTVSQSPSTVTFNYTPTGTGPGTVSAQVIDSVLYDASDTAQVSFTQ